MCVRVFGVSIWVSSIHVAFKEQEVHAGVLHSGLGSGVSPFGSLSSSLSMPARLTMRRMVRGRSPRL